MLDIQSGQSALLFEDSSYSEPTWISEREFLLLKGGDKGHTTLLVANAYKPGSRSACPPSYMLRILPLSYYSNTHSTQRQGNRFIQRWSFQPEGAAPVR